jgi:hypothetical protein
MGIPILASDAPESKPGQIVKCLQIFGGISTTMPSLVGAIYPLLRKNTDGSFLKLMEPIRQGTPAAAANTTTRTKKVDPQPSPSTSKKNSSDTTEKTTATPEQAKPEDGMKRKGLFGRFSGKRG